MSAKNDITGDRISARHLSQKARDQYDRIFTSKKPGDNALTIHGQMVEAITDAHTEANRSTHEAKGSMVDAINKRLKAAALIEKASRLHKQDLRGYLSGVMTGDEVKNYLSLHDAAQKRPTLSDKQQLQWCELLGEQEPRPARSKPQPTFISGVSRFLRRINKEVCKRPLNEWTKQEREQMQDVLKPIIDLHKELDL
jgi:hypothetical protein